MNCYEVSELLPAYVLGALDPDELKLIETHLSQGQEHEEELLELRTTLFALDRFAEERSLAAPVASAKSQRGLVATIPGIRRLTYALPWRLAGAMAVVLVLVASVWLVADQNNDHSARNVSVVIQGQRGEMLGLDGLESEASVSVVMQGLERLPQDRVYQIWAVRDGVWLKVGACNTDSQGWWKGDFPFKTRSGDQIALTIEPVGGGGSPTSAPILISTS